MTSRTWTENETSLLRGAVRGTTPGRCIRWEAIAAVVTTKSARQCYVRYHNIEKFSVGGGQPHTKSVWTSEMDSAVIREAAATGRKWVLVAERIGLSVSVCKNRFYVLRRGGERGVLSKLPVMPEDLWEEQSGALQELSWLW
ncbi:Myb-like DNA-binding domain-containing protein [Spironucleus salmonicida]|uniref:Myb-like DNA-binding domain-containing protein n=1 Tax=Spironucleus salmonicida TaxID=348837 RepID=A0A9P8M024_9EUKA|nr:Myb-like DNA-binding domain-containing protein [Spironucleus salmonicida]